MNIEENKSQEESFLDKIDYNFLNDMKHRFPREIILPNIGKEDIVKLEKMYVKNTINMLQIKKDDDYNEAIKECKKIFFNVDTDEDLALWEDYESIQTEDDLKFLAWICKGLPKAAARLQILYKNAGDFRKSVLWGLVSCYAGYQSESVLQDIGVAISMRDGKL